MALGSVSNPGWGIGAPDSVAYSVSQDGQTWKELGTVTYAQAEISPGAANGFETVEYVLKLDAAEKARYIRAEFGTACDTVLTRIYNAGSAACSETRSSRPSTTGSS